MDLIRKRLFVVVGAVVLLVVMAAVVSMSFASTKVPVEYDSLGDSVSGHSAVAVKLVSAAPLRSTLLKTKWPVIFGVVFSALVVLGMNYIGPSFDS